MCVERGNVTGTVKIRVFLPVKDKVSTGVPLKSFLINTSLVKVKLAKNGSKQSLSYCPHQVPPAMQGGAMTHK